MIFELVSGEHGITVGRPYQVRPPAQIGLLEKNIEDWIASAPETFFQGGEDVLVFAQSVQGRGMADLLALDASGRLIVIEVKRGRSDRTCVGQLLEYSAKWAKADYDAMNAEAQKYPAWKGGDLHARFCEFVEIDDFPKAELGAELRTIVVAPESDENLRRVIEWLRECGVPIEFISVSVFVDGEDRPRMLETEGAMSTGGESPSESWGGHWIFNTNETNAPGAYARMFERNVAAIYGYPSGPKTLEGGSEGETVMAYVNQQGLRAVGTIVSGAVEPGKGVFLDPSGHQQPNEFHLAVNWDVVLDPADAITPREARDLGYSLPVRTTFGKMRNGAGARAIERRIRTRGG
ncbi:MAG: hypothetical protein ACF8NJ_05740 [Phycisphaerales bacterium JB038]